MTNIVVNILVLALVALQVVDFLTTQRVIQLGGSEGNKALISLQTFLKRDLGIKERWAWLVIAKGSSIACILYVYFIGWFETTIGTVALVVILGIYVWVGIHNYQVMERLLMKQYPDGGE